MPNAPGARTAYPTAEDLLFLLEKAGMKKLVSPGAYDVLTADLATYVQSAIDEFETRSNWLPFLAGTRDENGMRVVTPVETTRYYTPQLGHRSSCRRRGWIVDIDGGLASLPVITTGIRYDDTGAPYGGTVLVINRDYTLTPTNALQRGQPITQVEIHRPTWWAGENSISITGLFGFSTRLADDDWQAILGGSAAQMQAECGLLITEGVAKIKIDNGIEVQFAGEVMETHFQPWATKFNKTILRRMREEVEV